MSNRYQLEMLVQQQQQLQNRMVSQQLPGNTYLYTAGAGPQPMYVSYTPNLTPQQILAIQQQQQQLMAQQQQAAQQAAQQAMMVSGQQTQPHPHHPNYAPNLLPQLANVTSMQNPMHAQAAAQAALLQATNTDPNPPSTMAGTTATHTAGTALPTISSSPPATSMSMTASRLTSPAVGSDAAAHALTGKGKLEIEDEYGLQTLLKVLAPPPAMSTTPSVPLDGETVDPFTGRTPHQRQQDQANFNYVMRGFELSQLGLLVAQQEQLHPTVTTLAMDEHTYHVLPEFKIPECYKRPKPKMLSMKSFSSFKEETLFYIFYSMPRDVLHLAAARTLYDRNWCYNKRLQQWFRSVAASANEQGGDGADGAVNHTAAEQNAAGPRKMLPFAREIANYEDKGRAYEGTFEVFDPMTWRTVKTEPQTVVLESDIEEQSVLQKAMQEAAQKQQLRAQQQQQLMRAQQQSSASPKQQASAA